MTVAATTAGSPYRPSPRRSGPRPASAPPLTPDRQALASDPRSLNLARSMAARYMARFPQHADDLESAAFLGLVQAASRYDPAGGASFTTYASPRVLGAVRDALRALLPAGYRQRARGATPPMIGPIGTGDDQPLADDLPVGWEAESADEVKRLSRCLPDKYGQAVRLYYLHGCAARLRDVGEIMGLRESRVSQMLIHGMEILREAGS